MKYDHLTVEDLPLAEIPTITIQKTGVFQECQNYPFSHSWAVIAATGFVAWNVKEQTQQISNK